jgi:hypothetical protein
MRESHVANELSRRVVIQIAAYAEFRQDWAAAIKYYRSAYSSLQDLPLAKDARRFQHIAQATAVAEQIHFKLCTILLHSGRWARTCGLGICCLVWSLSASSAFLAQSLCLTTMVPRHALCAALRRPFRS